MQYARMIGIMTVVVAALAAFAGVAPATTVTSPTGTAYTGSVSIEGEGHLTLLSANGISLSCPSAISIEKISTHGLGVTAKGNISAMTFGTAAAPCTNSDIVHISALGALEVHSIAGTENGTVTSTGTTVNVTDNTGVSCGYLTSATDIGTLTASTSNVGKEEPATLDINSAKIPRHSGSILCGATGTWTGSYKVTTPKELWVSA